MKQHKKKKCVPKECHLSHSLSKKPQRYVSLLPLLYHLIRILKEKNWDEIDNVLQWLQTQRAWVYANAKTGVDLEQVNERLRKLARNDFNGLQEVIYWLRGSLCTKRITPQVLSIKHAAFAIPSFVSLAAVRSINYSYRKIMKVSIDASAMILTASETVEMKKLESLVGQVKVDKNIRDNKKDFKLFNNTKDGNSLHRTNAQTIARD